MPGPGHPLAGLHPQPGPGRRPAHEAGGHPRAQEFQHRRHRGGRGPESRDSLDHPRGRRLRPGRHQPGDPPGHGLPQVAGHQGRRVHRPRAGPGTGQGAQGAVPAVRLPVPEEGQVLRR